MPFVRGDLEMPRTCKDKGSFRHKLIQFPTIRLQQVQHGRTFFFVGQKADPEYPGLSQRV
jgi:hypothetical protein